VSGGSNCYPWMVRLTIHGLAISTSTHYEDMKKAFLEGARLKGNSTLKNISPRINIYDKWSYVSVIKLMMEIRYRRILTIKLLISCNVFLHGGGSSKPSSLFVYLCLFVDVDMVTKKLLFICFFMRINVRCFHCLAGNSAIIRSTSPTLFNM